MSQPESSSPQAVEAEQPKPNKKYAANLGLIGIVVLVMGGAMLIAAQAGAGPGFIIAGFTAIFFTLGIGGGSLRADLRKAAWYGPLTALSASLPRIIAEYDRTTALILVCIVIFVAGLLPALGRNYAQAGLGLGIATVLGFSLQADVGSPGQTVGAAFIGVAFVVGLRILLKFRDPSDVTRELAAGTLTQDDPGFEQAYTMWLRDRSVRWIDEVLRTSVGYRMAYGALSADETAVADDRADEVAALVVLLEPHVPTESELQHADPDEPEPELESGGYGDALTYALEALDRVEAAARRRDTTVVADATATRRAFARASLRAVLTWRSQTLRHALRTAIGVLLTFVVAWIAVGPKDPLVTSMATAAFAILQISWTRSLFKAKERLIGVSGGAVVMALALWLLPPAWMLPFALLAAFSGLWFTASSQVLSIGSFVVVSVGLNVAGRGLDPTRTLLEYIALLFTGVLIGLLFGFAVVPHVKPDRICDRVEQTRRATVELLRAAAMASTTVKPRRGAPDAVLKTLYGVRTCVLNLGSPLAPPDEHDGVSTRDCVELATRFETLAIVGVLQTSEGQLTPTMLHAAADALEGKGDPVERTGELSDFERLAQWVGSTSTQFCANGHILRPDIA